MTDELDVAAIVKESLAELLDRAGLDVEITMDAILIDDLGLDSEDGVEIACILQERLKVRIPDDVNPIREARNVRELVTWAEGLIGRREQEVPRG